MKILIDQDVEKVMEFMAREIRGERLLFVARAVAKLADLAWANNVPDRRAANAVEVSEWRGSTIDGAEDSSLRRSIAT